MRRNKAGASRLVALFRNRQLGKFGHATQPRRGWAVVVCVLLSVLLWFFFSMRRTTFIDLTLPTRIVNLPPGESLSTPPPATIAYRMRGDGLSLLPVYYNRPVVEIDASQSEIDFGVNSNNFAGDIRIESASPPTYFPQLEPSLTAKIPIRLVGNVSTVPTHEFINRPKLSPDSVVVIGAHSIVSRLKSWPTVPFDRTDIRDSLDVSIALADSLGGLVRLGRADVRLRASAMAFSQGKRNISIRIVGAPNDRTLATLDPQVVEVTYRVGVGDYNRALNSPDFYATVLFTEIRGDTTGSIIPVVNRPRGLLIRDIEMNPPRVNYFNFIE